MLNTGIYAKHFANKSVTRRSKKTCESASRWLSFFRDQAHTALLILPVLLTLSLGTGQAATPPFTTISNIADVTFDTSGATVGPITSNLVEITTIKAPISIELLQEAQPSTPGATSYTIGGITYWLVPAQTYHVGRPVFVKVTDLDANQNSGIAETSQAILHSNLPMDSETVTIEETSVSSGLFIGMVDTTGVNSPPEDTLLSVTQESEVTAEYTDSANTTVIAEAVLVDPYGIIFDTSTGEPVNGATLTLIDESTGQPAQVFGDDGFSDYPSTIISGGTATDSSNTIYSFEPSSSCSN